ncbi:MAG TPA: TetR/AcrR family transcriptional regulator [Nevskiaceae bacterium]|nr:TetR/AcrR family transcriptional regulator [Nevskiaceae bacterium]
MLMAASGTPRRARLSRAQQRAARTRDILDAAWAIYREQGYEAATIEAVAEHAGISRMPVYSLFGDKQNLYYELSNMLLGQLVQVMVEPLHSAPSLRAGLERMARLAATPQPRTSGHGPESLFHVVQVIGLSRPDIAARQKKGAKDVVDAFAAAIRKAPLQRGERLRASPEIVASLIVSLINGLSNVETQTGRKFIRASDLAAMFCAAAFR